MQARTFSIQLIEQPEGGYTVTCPALPGCHSQGDTVDEAKANIREAIELVLEDMRAHGEPLPDPGVLSTDTVRVEV